MNGTLALWFEPRSDPEEGFLRNISKNVRRPLAAAPIVRLHVNLWRDLDKAFNFLDVGFLLSEATRLGRLHLYLPAPLETDAIVDLSGALKDADTLNAVFNEVAEIDGEADDHFMVKTASGMRKIHHVDVQREVQLTPMNSPGRGQGTVIALNSDLCARIAGDGDHNGEHYVRLRIFLRGEARSLFTTEDQTRGVGLSLLQDVLETTEFRLNESRSYPPSMLERASRGRVRLASVHYFLIRSRDFQIGSQHATFRKVRNLEDDIWDGYLAVGQPSSAGRRPKLGEGMIIYQWREIAEKGKSLDDFIAYASFRTARPKIPAFLIAIVAIGGLGSAILNMTTNLIASLGSTFGWVPGPLLLNVIAAGVLAAFVGLPMAVSAVRNQPKR
jgi:hypothetical protein